MPAGTVQAQSVTVLETVTGQELEITGRLDVPPSPTSGCC